MHVEERAARECGTSVQGFFADKVFRKCDICTNIFDTSIVCDSVILQGGRTGGARGGPGPPQYFGARPTFFLPGPPL